MNNDDELKKQFPGHGDEFHGQGGSYVVRDGKRVRVEEPTRDHPEGNRPRDKDGRPLDGLTGLPIAAEEPKAAPAGVTPIRGGQRKPSTDD